MFTQHLKQSPSAFNMQAPKSSLPAHLARARVILTPHFKIHQMGKAASASASILEPEFIFSRDFWQFSQHFASPASSLLHSGLTLDPHLLQASPILIAHTPQMDEAGSSSTFLETCSVLPWVTVLAATRAARAIKERQGDPMALFQFFQSRYFSQFNVIGVLTRVLRFRSIYTGMSSGLF